MRYADTPTADVSIEIAAPADLVWPLVVDINLPARFSEEFRGAEWIDPAPEPGLGARFVGRSGHPARGEWQTTCTVTRFDVNRAFEWTVGDLDVPAARWRFELEPTSTGTRLRQWAQMGPGRSGLTPAIEAMPDKEERIVARRLREWRTNMTANLEGIRDLAEGARA